MVQLSNVDGSLADLLWFYKYQKQVEEESIIIENSPEKQHACRNKVNHHQEMTLWHIAMASILVDVA